MGQCHILSKFELVTDINQLFFFFCNAIREVAEANGYITSGIDSSYFKAALCFSICGFSNELKKILCSRLAAKFHWLLNLKEATRNYNFSHLFFSATWSGVVGVFFNHYKRSGLKPGQSNLELWKIKRKPFQTIQGLLAIHQMFSSTRIHFTWNDSADLVCFRWNSQNPRQDPLLHRLCNAAATMKALFMVYFCVKRTPSLVTPSPLCDNTCWANVLQSKRAATNKTLINVRFLNS